MDELFQLALKALHNGTPRPEVDALIHEDTQGAIPTFDALKEHLNQQDMAGQGTPVEVFGGAALPFLDRIGGALNAIGSFMPTSGLGISATTGDVNAAKQAYIEGRDVARARNAAYTREHPKTALAARVAGGAGGALLGSEALQGVGFLAPAADAAPTMGQLARTGAAAGGAMGALQGLSDTPDLTDPVQAAKDAAIGAGTGALAGSVLGAATKPLSSLIGGAIRLGRGIINPAAVADEATLGRLATVLPPSTSSSVNALEAARPGLPMLADADHGAALDAAMRRAPGRAEGIQTALADRSAGAGGRLADQAETAALGVPADFPGATQGADAVEAQAAVQAARSPFRKATYDALEAAHPDVTPTPELEKALALPEVAAVLPNAPSEGMPEVAPLSFQRLQTALRTLRQRQESLFSGSTIGDPIPVKEAADQLERGMEEAMPRFQAANRGWAEGAQALDAFDLGRKALGKDSRVIAQEMKDFGPATLPSGKPNTVAEEARNAYRLAALDQYASRLRNLAPGRNAGLKALRQGDQALEGRLRTLFGNTDEMNQFFRSAEAERWLQQTQQSLQGSKTQGRGALDESLFGPRTTGGRLWRKLASWVQKDAGSAADEAQAHRYIDALTARGPQLQRVLAGIEAQRADAAAANGALPGRAAAAGLFGGTTGGKQTTAGAGVGALMLAPRSVLPRFLQFMSTPDVGAH